MTEHSAEMREATTVAAGDPHLTFRLPGEWFAIDMRDGVARKQSIKTAAEHACGTTDEAARARALLREKLMAASEQALEGNATAMYLGHELRQGVPLPISITVFAPPKLSMTPALSADPDPVLEILRQGLEAEGQECERVTGPQMHALRSVTTGRSRSTDVDAEHDPFGDDEQLKLEAAQINITSLKVDYWCHIPGTKRVTVVSCSSDLGAIEHTLVRMFDAIIAAARFERAQPTGQGAGELL